jgi:DNA-binding response OmpR family regulator
VSVEPDHLLHVMVLTEQRLLAEMVDLTLNHGVYVVRTARDVGGAEAIIGAWHPHLAVVDLESGGEWVIQRFGRDHPGEGTRIPVLALTRRGDLKTKLAAFDLRVDDVVALPRAIAFWPGPPNNRAPTG